MSNLIYIRLMKTDDADIPQIAAAYQLKEIVRYINIGEQYFDYVTDNENVYFYKVYEGETLIGAVHLEKQQGILFMSIVIFPEYQRADRGTRILTDIQTDAFGLGFERIEVSIDQTNIASIRLFEKAGFVFVSQEDELKNYVWQKEK